MLRGSLIAATLIAILIAGASIRSTSVSAGGGCHRPAAAESTDTTIVMQLNCFSATVTRVDEGATVTFVNSDEGAHNISGAGFAWGHPDELYQGDEARFAFSDSGVFVYACLLHPGMIGAVVVGDGSGTDPASVRPVAAAAVGSDAPSSGAGASSASQTDTARPTSDGLGKPMLAAASASAATLLLCAAAFVMLRGRRAQRATTA